MIDGHCHLDKRLGSLDNALESLYREAREKNINKIVLLNIPQIAFDNDAVLEQTGQYAGFFRVFPALSPLEDEVESELKRLKEKGAAGLKLHPRVHRYQIDIPRCINMVQTAGELGLPVMADCFPDGMNLLLGNTPEAFARLAQQCPQTRIAIGHSGGHRILDALMVAKYFKNIFLDLSFTLLYYRGSTVMKDIAYAATSLGSGRIFWGSDYPDRPYAETVDASLEEFRKMGISPEARQAVLEHNAALFLDGQYHAEGRETKAATVL